MSQGFDKTEPKFQAPLVSEIVRTNLNAGATHHSGPTAPALPDLGWIWLDTSVSTNMKLKIFNGVDWEILFENINSATLNPSAAGGSSQFIHTQAVAANVWNITHNLSKQFPSDVVVDSLNVKIDPSAYVISYTSVNALTITFPGATSGKAILQ